MSTCIICKTNQTNNNVEVGDQTVFVCRECVDQSKREFVFVCVKCGAVFTRPRSVLDKLDQKVVESLRKIQESDGLIFGLTQCIECPEEEAIVGHA